MREIILARRGGVNPIFRRGFGARARTHTRLVYARGMRSRHLGTALLLLSLSACDGTLRSSDEDAAGAPSVDAASSTSDSPVAPGDDAFMSSSPDAFIAPLGDCTMGTPLMAPIAGCMPSVMASTGDPAEDCVRRINQFRCECQHLPPLQRWREGEACADQMAQYDSEGRGPHAGFRDGICGGGYGQNECPGWGSVPQTISGCLQQMWDEGPGEPFSEHGHYLNMTNDRFSRVACGFYTTPGGDVWAVQNFQ